MTKIQYGQSTKQKRRNETTISQPQEVTRQCHSRNSLLTPYRLINDQDTYNDSYDVFVPVYEYGCNIQFQTAQEPYVERYFVCFKDYVCDKNRYSEEENKQLVMNLGDVLLAVDVVDV
jgi:uroporphyrinogen-III decarboxylase